MRDYKKFFGTGYGNIEQASLLFQASGTIHTHLRREKCFFHTNNKNYPKFQTFSRVYCHQRQTIFALAIIFVNVAQQ